MGTVVTVFIAAIFFWMFKQSSKNVISQLDQQARSLLQQIIITRLWVAEHDGLFVSQQPGVEANPFLPNTDIIDQQGNIYHFRNPAMVTREISAYAKSAGLYKFRLTSLKLKNPHNAPLPFETKALLYFEEKGYEMTKTGRSSESFENGTRIYVRIVPLLVEESCLECHADQGYKVGDVRGGLSVFIPMTEALYTIKRNGINLILSGIGIICLVLCVMYLLLMKMVLKPVDHLHHVAQRMIDGEYSAKAQLSTGDEFEAFAHAFNNMNERLQKGLSGTIRSLVAAVDARDPYTKGHTARVARYSTAIAREMGLPEERISEVEIGAILHDIGKIGIADELLGKPLPLESQEVEQMEDHVKKGAKIVYDADFLKFAIPAILYHHERPDGKGYPVGLKGDDLPLEAMIIAVADTFDAMTTNRPYSKVMNPENAVREIEKHSGTQFDAKVVKAFRRAFDKKFK
jgi:putative nucleotidyltransferase with HDIG domain